MIVEVLFFDGCPDHEALIPRVRQRWRKVEGGITAARKALRAELSKRDRGEAVAADLFALDDEGGDLVELRSRADAPARRGPSSSRRR